MSKFKLCFSADIIDSTRMKLEGVSSERIRNYWGVNEAVKAATNAFNDDEKIGFLQLINEISKKINNGPKFHFWKLNGDEVLLFSDDFDDEFEFEFKKLYDYIKAFTDAVEKRNVSGSIKLKGTIWRVFFDMSNENENENDEQQKIKNNNTQFDIDLNDKDFMLFNAEHKEYIGSSFDYGFRLTGKSELNNIVIACDLAMLFLKRGSVECISPESNKETDNEMITIFKQLDLLFIDCGYAYIKGFKKYTLIMNVMINKKYNDKNVLECLKNISDIHMFKEQLPERVKIDLEGIK